MIANSPALRPEDPRMSPRPFRLLLSCVLLPLACGSARTAEEPVARPLEVPVAQPVARGVTDYEDFTGRTEAATSVELRARVTGYLVKVLFKDGAEVKRGELLFEIDPRPYQAELEKAQAGLTLAEARFQRAEADGKRARALLEKKAIGAEDFDKIAAEREEAAAGVRVARAGLDLARLNLDFTRVTSPIDGRIGRRLLDPGNLVKADETVLAKVVGEDPMYAYFDMGERTLLRIRGAVSGGRLKRPPDGAVPVFVGLAGEEGYPHRGSIDFINNQVNPATGTVSVRVVVPNPKLPGGERLLSPGMFVRVRLPVSGPYQALLVTDRVVMADQGLKYVFVVNDKDAVEYRRVTTGALQGDGLRVIAEGLKADEWVVVGSLKGLRPKMVVRSEKVSMPTLVTPVPGENPANKPPADERRRQR
jgi:multidrug efflux system membrane fusion protein